MKTDRLFFVSVLFALLFPCLKAQQRTIAEVESLANTMLQECSGNAATRSLSVDTQDMIRSSQLFVEDNLGESREAFYVCSPQGVEDGGFVIVSADRRMTPILAFSEQGTFNVDHLPDAMVWWLHLYVLELNEKEAERAEKKDADTLVSTRSVNDAEVKPLLGNIAWSQDKPFNNSCPLIDGNRAATGCVATAMAQVLKYYRYPAAPVGTGFYTTQKNKTPKEVKLSPYAFDWSNMLVNYNGAYSQKQADAVANLMYACGVSVSMEYGYPESNANIVALTNALVDNMGYDSDLFFAGKDCWSENEWHTLIQTELYSNRPVLYGGNMDKRGHQFILDGLRFMSGTPYYHVNWGWGNRNNENGYVTIANIHYDQRQVCIVGCKPEDNKVDFGGYWEAETIEAIENEKENGISIKLSSFYNHSKRDFKGLVFAKLTNTVTNKQETLSLGQMSTPFPFGSGWSELTIPVNLPETIESGRYKVEIFLQHSGSASSQRVHVQNNKTCTVTINNLKEPPSISWKSVVCNNANPKQLLQTDELSLTAIFSNTGSSYNVETALLIRNSKNEEVFRGDIRSSEMKKGADLSVTHSTSLMDLPVGKYTATVVYHDTWSDEKSWYYSSKYIIDIEIVKKIELSYPHIEWVEVGCFEFEPLNMSQDDVLSLRSTFYNSGTTYPISTAMFIFDDNTNVVKRSDELSSIFNSNEKTIVYQSCKLNDVPLGDYRAAILYYDYWSEEKTWYYDSNYMIDFRIVSATGIDSVETEKQSESTMYDLTGQKVNQNYKGVVVKVNSDGTTSKILNK